MPLAARGQVFAVFRFLRDTRQQAGQQGFVDGFVIQVVGGSFYRDSGLVFSGAPLARLRANGAFAGIPAHVLAQQ